MSHEATHAPSSTSATFTPEDEAAMHLDDRHAAAGVVLLMVSVFIFGLLMYSYIAWVI